MDVHLIDGTYELFRHFHGLRRAGDGREAPLGAVRGVLHTVVRTLEDGATHLGVATDHVIESFRNGLWADYKSSAGVERDLLTQFEPLEEALAALGVTVWPMTELEADDALASAAQLARRDDRVDHVYIWSPDKDLAQCVRGARVVQVHRRDGRVIDATAVRERFGVEPEQIPDHLALVGDSADGFPGASGIGKVTAARLLAEHGTVEDIPPERLGDERERVLLFKDLATLRANLPLFEETEELRWNGPVPDFAAWAKKIDDARMLPRVTAELARRNDSS